MKIEMNSHRWPRNWRRYSLVGDREVGCSWEKKQEKPA